MNAAGYKEELSGELQSILQYWMDYTPDRRQGGFVGRVDDADRADPQAPKGLVLNSRILWTFSAAYDYTRNSKYVSVAWRAYEYLRGRFLDGEYGGAFWSLHASGRPLKERKQI